VHAVYYGMFYALTALALKHGFQSSKHLQLIGWFNKKFVKENIVSIKYGKILRDALKNRMDGDYAPFIEFEKEDIITLFAEMKDFIREIDALTK
ncbi:MAG: HEPN domain-containing protein, partial [Bacteroidetes bacterium]|nr:HEPN domain-containing protein [Bacteroidota bacterium]